MAVEEVLARAMPSFGQLDRLGEQLERVTAPFKMSEEVLARAMPSFGQLDRLGEQLERVTAPFKMSEEVLARAMPSFGQLDRLGEQLERVTAPFKMSEEVLARAMPSFGQLDRLGEQLERVTAPFKMSEEVLARAMPSFGHLDKLGEQLEPLLATLLAAETDNLNLPDLSQACSDANEWPTFDSEEHGNGQIGHANSEIEWVRECLQAIAILIALFMAIAVMSSLGARTNMAEVDEVLASTQALFVGIPHVVFNNPVLGPICFWTPIYFFFRKKE